MPRDVSSAFKASLTSGVVKPIELIRITYKDDVGLYRTSQLAIWHEQVVLGRMIFRSFPWCTISPYTIGNEEFPTLELTFVDVDGQYRDEFSGAPQINHYPDLRSAVIEVFKVNSADLDDDADAIKDSFIVSSVNASDDLVVLRCDTYLQNPNRSFPPYTYVRRHCQWQFKDPKTCQWTRRKGGNSKYCDKTMDGPRGCSSHNNIENFGGFPGIADESLNTNL